ncbi:MAG: hypothetical protein SGPRY_008758 [Prymnesium sp.]
MCTRATRCLCMAGLHVPVKQAMVALPPEDWCEREEVQELLFQILESPSANHVAHVPEDTLLNGHVHGLVGTLDRLVSAKRHISQVAALHEGAKRSKEVETAATAATRRFLELRDRLRVRLHHGCNDQSTAQQELDAIRCVPYDWSRLKANSDERCWSSLMRVFANRDYTELLRYICDLAVMSNPVWVQLQQPRQQHALPGNAWHLEIELRAELKAQCEEAAARIKEKDGGAARLSLIAEP